MALSTAAEVRATIGIDHAEDFNLFRLANDAALNTAVTLALTRAVAWLKTRESAGLYTGSATSDTDIDTLFKLGEELIAGHFLFLRLKVRKVFGTHWAVDSEESDRYAELIDNEFLSQAEEVLDGLLTVELPGRAFAMPTFRVGRAIDYEGDTTLDTAAEEVEEVVELARSLP